MKASRRSEARKLSMGFGRAWNRVLAVPVFGVAFIGAWRLDAEKNAPAALGIASARADSGCPSEMAHVSNYCIDRFEVHTVDRATGQHLSPFYPPEPRLLRKVYQFWATEAARTGVERARELPLPTLPAVQRGDFSAKAVSSPGVLPQGYMTYYTAKRACELAGKRLCSEDEWVRACRGRRGTNHPYGSNFKLGACNVFRPIHPAYELHGNSSLGHLDPRLHLVVDEDSRPLLLEAGELSSCATATTDGALYDMEGNLDEWIDDTAGTFVGGFFSRQTREGCAAKIENHAPAYTDYSLGTRCCKDAP